MTRHARPLGLVLLVSGPAWALAYRVPREERPRSSSQPETAGGKAGGKARAQAQRSAGGASAECSCLSWKEVYSNRNVSCGLGMELTAPLSEERGPVQRDRQEMLERQFCQSFYRKVSFSSCVNIYYGKEGKGQWCYVQAACGALNGGKQVKGTSVAWKVCRQDADSVLSKHTPVELREVAERESVEFGILAKFAYPVSQKRRWGEVKDFFMYNTTKKKNKRNKAEDELQTVVQSGRPVIYDPREDDRPYFIVHGASVYQVPFTARRFHDISLIRQRQDPVNLMRHTHAFECVKGCRA